MDEDHHYDLAILKKENCYQVILRLCIGNIKSIESTYNLIDSKEAKLKIDFDSQEYIFSVITETGPLKLGNGLTRYLSSEVAGGFTGVMIGMYAYDKDDSNKAEFSEFECLYTK